jgi:iron-sulfur cluster repair protein YtfE (RIC family)
MLILSFDDLIKVHAFLVCIVAFAVMRNSHESFRMAIKVMEGLIDGGSSNFDALSTSWTEYQRCLTVHSIMEDVDMFPLIDEVNGSPTRLEDLHARDISDVEAVDRVLANIRNDPNGVESAERTWSDLALLWKTWQANHLDHFKKEEDVMMPLVMKTGSSPAQRARVVHSRLITPAFHRDAGEFVYYIGWCVSMLCRFGSTQQSPEVATRVFVRALHSSSSSAQWDLLLPAVKANCSEEVWTQLVDAYHVDHSVGDENFMDSVGVSHK